MREKPRIPVALSEVPQQRLYPVVDLPSLSEPFPCTSHFVSKLPADDHPRLMPRSARFVGMVEWSWSPMHSRLEAYYLSTNRKRSHWLLWMLWPDEWGNLAPLKEANLCAYGPRGRIKPKAAAAHLLLTWWRYESWEEELDQFHMIDDEGLLKVEDLKAVGRLVWPRDGKSGEENE